MDDDRYRTRVPSLPHPLDADYGVSLFFIVESERERPREFTRFFEIGKRRSDRKGNGLRREVCLNMKISPAVRRGDLDFELLLGRLHSKLGALVMVVGEEIAKHLHGQAIRIASEDA